MIGIDLHGQRALVFGASQGIGETTARLFMRAGARVTLVARSEDKLKAILEGGEAGGHSYHALDISDLDTLKAKLQADIADQPYDIVVFNSGGPPPGPISEARPEMFLEAMKQHLVVASQVTALVTPAMKSKRYGRILTITSTSVKMPIPHLGVSNVTRSAMSSWAKTLSIELAPFGITVNNLLPGYTRTPRLESLISSAAQKSGKSREVVEQEWKAQVPMGRFAEPEDPAHLLVFLASPLASYITGVQIPVDGGRLGCF